MWLNTIYCMRLLLLVNKFLKFEVKFCFYSQTIVSVSDFGAQLVWLCGGLCGGVEQECEVFQLWKTYGSIRVAWQVCQECPRGPDPLVRLPETTRIYSRVVRKKNRLVVSGLPKTFRLNRWKQVCLLENVALLLQEGPVIGSQVNQKMTKNGQRTEELKSKTRGWPRYIFHRPIC